MLEKVSNETSKRPVNIITKTNKIIINPSLEIILGNEHSFLTIQAYIPWALACKISRS